MRFVTVIITAPRKVVTIDRSLETFFGQPGSGIPWVFAEPGSYNFYYHNNVKLIKNHSRRGCFNNWWYAAQYILHHTRSDYVLMCEDDVNWSRGALATMLDNMNQTKVLSGWTSNANVTPDALGWAPMNNLNLFGLCGSLALLFPRKILADVLYHRQMTKQNQIHLDTIMGFALSDLKIPIYNHHPSLVTHFGANNSTFDLSKVGEENIASRICYSNCSPPRREYIRH